MVDWGFAWENVDYWAVLVAAIVPFVVGFLWYAPNMFGKTWQKEANISDKQMNDMDAMPVIMGGSLVVNLFTSFFMGLLMEGTEGFIDGLLFGAVLGLAFSAAALAQTYLYERRSMLLFALNAGNMVVSLAAMGVVHGLINN